MSLVAVCLYSATNLTREIAFSMDLCKVAVECWIMCG